MIKRTNINQVPEEEEFIEAIKSSTNSRQALLKLGVKDRGREYEQIKKRCAKLNIEPPIYGKKKVFRSSDIEFTDAVKSSLSIRECLRKLGLKPCGANYSTFRKRCQNLNLSTGHFIGRAYLRNGAHSWGVKIPLCQVLVENRNCNSNKLKERLIKENILENQCNRCGNSDWLEEPIALHLHHINGNHTDNRLENIQLLCPNCHAQTSNYCGKNKNKAIKNNETNISNEINISQPLTPPKPLKTPKTPKTTRTPKLPKQYFCQCGAEINRLAKQCIKCSKQALEKITWPSDEELLDLASKYSYLELSRQLGVSDNAIRHRLKRRGIVPPKKYAN
jgi:5-methylcytosine-specific restriction endonuclease McrA